MHIKNLALVSLILLFLVIVLQNTQVVSVRFLFWTVSMSQVILLPLVFVLGIVAALIIGWVIKK